MVALFWIFLAIVFYTYIGYGMLLYILVFIKERIIGRLFKSTQTLLPNKQELPTVTLLIAAYNEEGVVYEKMKNCHALKYPSDKLSIMWATDGSNDRTNELLAEYPDVVISYFPDRKGKTAAINNAMKVIGSDIVVFTDANTMLNDEAILNICQMFNNPKVGCVAGEKRVCSEQNDAASSSGESAYWKYESKLKEWDYRLHTAVGAAGELFALRTELYEVVPEDTLLDDFILSLNVIKRGYVIGYCKDAYALESGSADIENEKKRKVRIAAGGLQSIWRLRPLLNIFRYGWASFQYISHRVLRWTITPFLLFALYPINIWIVCNGGGGIYEGLLVAQTFFYLMALIGYFIQDKKVKSKIVFVPMYFVFMNISVFLSIPYLAKRKGSGAWEKSKRK